MPALNACRRGDRRRAQQLSHQPSPTGPSSTPFASVIKVPNSRRPSTASAEQNHPSSRLEMAAASPLPGMASPTKAAKYPVVLSDALLGKPSKETYTGIRYNHKPDISPENTSATARLKQSNKDHTFNLGLDDNGTKYAYNGVRTTKDGNYALVFDPERQVFVLHRLDSLFHMNVTRTPGNTDVDSLRKQFPQLEVQPPASNTSESKDIPGKSSTKATSAKADSKTSSKSTKPTKPAKASSSSSALRKPTAKKSTTAKKPASLPTPDPSKLMPPPPVPPATTTDPKKSSKRSPESEEEDEDDDDDDDGGLTIEYPGGEPPRAGRGTIKTAFGSTFAQPPVAITRRFSDFVRNGEDEEVQPRRQQQQQQQQLQEQEEEINYTFEDATGSADEEDEEMEDVGALERFKLPSPVDGRGQQQQQQTAGLGAGAFGQPGDDDADGEDDDDLADLEADLEAEFEKAAGYESESDVSEED